MTISKHAETFAGRPIRDYASGQPAMRDCVYRLAVGYDEGQTFPDLLDQFLNEHGGPELTALVIGAWHYESMMNSAAEEVEALVGARDRMPNLTALFFGDITFEQCEISWIQYGDISPLLPAFPQLEEFRIRGTTGLTFGALRHPNLKSLAIESGGLNDSVLEEVWAADLPRLEHLELWLGDDYYGGMNTTDPLEPLLTGTLFPNLKYLGLRNCKIADDVAKAVTASQIFDRLDVLDLSLGNLGDDGARALIDCPAVHRLRLLDLHHHYLSTPVIEELKGLGISVNVDDQKQGDGDDRYITVSE